MQYSASLITRSAIDPKKPIVGSGSFCNIVIDGRLSFANACEVAVAHLSKESQWRGEYVIEKTGKISDYKNPILIGANYKTSDILFLF